MKALLLAGLAPLALATPAMAQDHSGHAMPGMQMPAPSSAPAPTPPASPPTEDPHAGHDMAGTDGAESDAAPVGTDLPVGNAPAPEPVKDRAADRYFGADAMATAERDVRREHGGGTLSQVMFDIVEVQVGNGSTGYRWEGGAWVGGDINRFLIKSEGEGRFGGSVESAEVQGLYNRALDPYWNLQAGIRQDLGPGPRRTYAVVGIEGLAPYWFELGGSLYLSDKGDVLVRTEGYYDQRLTQDFVLQPRVEFNFSLQDIPENRIGSGFSTAEVGLRLRYERAREFAPYVGVSWERKLGRTADFARAHGDDTGGVSFVVGIRTWF